MWAENRTQNRDVGFWENGARKQFYGINRRAHTHEIC